MAPDLLPSDLLVQVKKSIVPFYFQALVVGHVLLGVRQILPSVGLLHFILPGHSELNDADKLDHRTRSGHRLVGSWNSGSRVWCLGLPASFNPMLCCPVSGLAVTRLALPLPSRTNGVGFQHADGGARESMLFLRLTSTESSLYCMHQSFSLPGSRVLFMFSFYLLFVFEGGVIPGS